MSRPRVVIVGSGSAGLFCAWALADCAAVTVLEAGPDPGEPVPRRFLYDALVQDHDWGYRDADTQQALLTGRVLGGSSTISAYGALRGEPDDYNRWGPNWTWNDCLPAFRTLESDQQFANSPYHGASGPIPITRAAASPFDQAFTEVCQEGGYTSVADFNVPGAQGVGPWPTNMRDGARIGTLAGLMPQLRGRIELRPDTAAVRVVLNGNRAVGVEIGAGSRAEIVSADHVILCAGAYGSPTLLARSGFVDPNLGACLGTHSHASFMVRCLKAGWAKQLPRLGALLRVGLDGDAGDIWQFYAIAAYPYRPFLNAQPDDLFLQVVMMNTRSTGVMAWQDGKPVIHHRHFSEPSDLQRLCRMIDRIAPLIDRLVAKDVLEAPQNPWWLRPDREQALRQSDQCEFHPCGTCGIGRVVDDRLRVKGVDCLRVADASVIPFIPQANPNLACMMIGLRAGQMLATEWS